MSTKLPVFYDLVSYPGGPWWSPNTWKTRLSLLHKGVEFVDREVTYNELRSMAGQIGVARPTVPMLELPDGTFLVDSYKIALWLEEQYPTQPSLFLPSSATPVDPNSPESIMAKNYAILFGEGLGSSDSQWSTFFELAAEGIVASMKDPKEQEYFTSDAKLGIKDGWKWITSLDKAKLLEHGKASLLPVEAVLRNTDFLCGTAPGFIDYTAYGRYHMMAAVCPDYAKQLWTDRETSEIRDWIKRIEKRFGEGLKDSLERLEKSKTA